MQAKTEQDYKVRDRNAFISIVVAVVAGILAVNVLQSSSLVAGIFGFFALVLLVNGIYFYKRR